MLEIPSWDKQYAEEPFLEYFTVGLLRGVLYQGLMHKEEAMPHVPLVEIMNIMEEKEGEKC